MLRLPFPRWKRFLTLKTTVKLRWWEPRDVKDLPVFASVNHLMVKYYYIPFVPFKLQSRFLSGSNTLHKFYDWQCDRHFHKRRFPSWITPKDPLGWRLNGFWSLLYYRSITQAVFPDPVIPAIMQVKGCSNRNRCHFRGKGSQSAFKTTITTFLLFSLLYHHHHRHHQSSSVVFPRSQEYCCLWSVMCLVTKCSRRVMKKLLNKFHREHQP